MDWCRGNARNFGSGLGQFAYQPGLLVMLTEDYWSCCLRIIGHAD
jgi:hypothetical protein